MQQGESRQLQVRDEENTQLRSDLTILRSQLAEANSSVSNWKLKCEDINREISDLEERYQLAIKGGQLIGSQWMTKM